MKLTYFKLFIALVFSATVISCTTETIKVNVKYSDNNPVDTFTNYPYPKDTICFYLDGGFGQKLRIKIYQNEEKIYDEVLNITTTYVSSVEFRKQNENIIQIKIDGHKTEKIKFDNRYNFVIINWWKERSEIDFDYCKAQPLFD
jgi:hypothetical protein